MDTRQVLAYRHWEFVWCGLHETECEEEEHVEPMANHEQMNANSDPAMNRVRCCGWIVQQGRPPRKLAPATTASLTIEAASEENKNP